MPHSLSLHRASDKTLKSAIERLRGGDALERQAIDARRRTAEKCCLFSVGRPGDDPLKGVPDGAVSACAAFRGIIAFEHAAVGAEGFYPGLTPWSPLRRQLLRSCRRIGHEAWKGAIIHAQPAQLQHDVRQGGQPPDIGPPYREPGVSLSRIYTGTAR